MRFVTLPKIKIHLTALGTKRKHTILPNILHDPRPWGWEAVLVLRESQAHQMASHLMGQVRIS